MYTFNTIVQYILLKEILTLQQEPIIQKLENESFRENVWLIFLFL